jgi:type VI secretion system secreted protein VgrG
MLYNKEKMPPYVDKAKPTRTGIQTRSSPGGNAKSFNALLFEDDKGQEYLHLQAQKDFQMVVKDSAKMTIGDANKLIDKNEQEADAGSYLQRVKKNVTKEVLEGDKKETIKSGKYDLEVMGDLTEIVKSGNMKVDVNAGELLLKAATKITLQVGASKIEMTPAMIKVESTMVQVSGSAMLELKGGLVRIN